MHSHDLLVAGIGASAGGLEALEKLLSHVTPGSGIAFVVVQHQDPRRTSMLVDLLGRHSQMPVLEAQDGAPAEADHVYVAAPGTLLGIGGGSFKVSADGRRGPIDAFFHDLAEDQGEHAAGIILSGSGADGTTGLRAIKERGGLTLAQAPETARHDGMPRSAIEAGVVDHVLPVEQMPAKLRERALELAGERAGGAASDEQLAAAVGEICEIVQRTTGHDFSGYKKGTLLRRIRRRAELRRVSSVDEYVELLAREPQEPEILVKDLLIGVSQFFRDPEAFEYLAQHVLPQILAGKTAVDAVRIWVTGCASGEEAYSLAMLVREQLTGVRPAPLVQLFATDIDDEALAEARGGRYPVQIAEHVSPERLARFFTREGSSYHLGKELREICIFSQHSLIRDPPFSALDLISCRNVLIYMEADLQNRLIPVFHYALKPGGYLFLGPSEGLAGHPELFETVGKHHHVFRRAEPLRRPALEFPSFPGVPARAATLLSRPEAPARTQQQMAIASFERTMLQEYAPPAAVVNARGDILCVAGHTGRYLEPAAGALSTNILDIAQTSLRIELRRALHAAATDRKKIVRDGVPVELEDGPRRLRLIVRPLAGIGVDQGLYAVVLQERWLGAESEPEAGTSSRGEQQPVVEQLESELRITRADLSATVEELESTNEGLESSNEELQSANEELQSANEELQTSQEELRSVNEELETVNTELKQKVEELARANSDLQNLFSSTAITTLFLDRDLRVARFTPAARTLFRLIDGDIGRPISDLAPRLAGQDLLTDVREVLRTLNPIERQVEALDRRAWFMLRILPYRTVEDVIAGAVVTLVDITELKRAEAELRRLATVVMDSNDAVTVQSLDGRILAWNRGAERMYGYSQAEALQMNVEGLVPEEERARARGLLDSTWRGEEVASLEVKRRTKDGRTLDVWLTATRLVDDRETPVAVATTERDVTERRAAVEALREGEQRLKRSQEIAHLGSWELDLESNRLSWSDEVYRIFGLRPQEFGATYEAFLEAVYPDDRAAVDAAYSGSLREGKDSYEIEHRVVRRSSGEVRVVHEKCEHTRDRTGRIVRSVGMVQDVTERKRAEDALREADRRKNEFLAVLSHELRNPLAPIRNSLFILDRAVPGGEQARRAQAVIDRQVDHMTLLIDDLLDVTRITRGKIQLQREPLELNELTQRTVEDHSSVFAGGGIDVELVPAPIEVWVSGDRTRLAQAIGNLLQNAAKFTPRGGRTTVSVQADAARGHAIVRVKDTGSGIAPEILPRLFEAFTQADTTLDRSEGGLGLGLALVKGLAELHGGSVHGESEGPGKGAAFTITLPLETTTAPTVTVQRSTRGEGAPRRVLVIEDNADTADTLREALELDEHVVEVAHDGPGGLEKARAFKPDVVLCDIGLPGMDGYDVARAIRADPELGRVPLVALSGYAQPEDVARAKEAGFDVHLAKPPSIETLKGVLAEVRDARIGRNLAGP